MPTTDDRQHLLRLAEAARSERFRQSSPAGFVPDAEETVLWSATGIQLVELYSTRAPLTGGTSELVYADARDLRDSGAVRSIAVSEDVPARDTGTVVVTDRRVVFTVAVQEREWTLDDVTGITHDELVPETWLSVSYRKRPSGFRYPAATAVSLRFAVALGLAASRGTRSALAAQLQRQADDLAPVAPTAPLPVPVPAPRASGTAKKLALGAVGGVLALGLLGAALGGDGSGDRTDRSAALAQDAGPSQASLVQQDEQARAAEQAEAERLAEEEVARLAAEQAAAAQAAEAAAAQAEADRVAAAAAAAAAQAEADRAAAADAAARAADQAQQTQIQGLAAQPSGSGCMPEYPDFCIPAGRDLDCPDIDGASFTVNAPDTYRLDGSDDDGVGCENN